MPVMVDQEQLEVERLGLRTIGQVLSHLQRDNRLVVNLLIDGREPDFDCLPQVRQSPVDEHTLFIETAEPRAMALEVLAEVEAQLGETDRLKGEAIDLLQRGLAFKAMERLSGCFTTWHTAQETVEKVARLLRIDLDDVRVDGHTLAEQIEGFGGHLRQIKEALEARDFVTLGDVLQYEMTETSMQWRAALGAVRDIVQRKVD
jgi:hypothetical protein